MILRDYQQKAIDDVRQAVRDGIRRIILTMPTGSGKTLTASEMIHSAYLRGKRSLFIVNKIELVHQTVAHLEKYNLPVGILQGENTRDVNNCEVVVGTIQTIAARGAPDASLIFIDEANNLHQSHIDLMNRLESQVFIGLTATPHRLGLNKHFELLIRGPSVRQLTEQGHLVKAGAFCPSTEQMEKILANVETKGGEYVKGALSKAINRKELVGDLVSVWQEKAQDRQTLVFVVDVAHGQAVVDDFRAVGVNAHLISYKTPKDERKPLIDGFRNKEIQMLVSVNVLGIGFDVPDASCAIIARPTLSEALHMQQLGRVLRPAEGKTDALILDHAGNTLKFGLPVDYDPPELNSDDHKTTQQKRKLAKMVACTECGFAMEPGQVTCPSCGIDRPTRKADISYLNGDLIEYGSSDSGEKKYSMDDIIEIYQGFLWLADRSKSGKRGAAYFNTKEMTGFEAPKSWASMEAMVPRDDVKRYHQYKLIKWRKDKEKLNRPAKKQVKTCSSCAGVLKMEKSDTIHHYGYRCSKCGQHNGWVPKAIQVSMGLIEGPK